MAKFNLSPEHCATLARSMARLYPRDREGFLDQLASIIPALVADGYDLEWLWDYVMRHTTANYTDDGTVIDAPTAANDPEPAPPRVVKGWRTHDAAYKLEADAEAVAAFASAIFKHALPDTFIHWRAFRQEIKGEPAPRDNKALIFEYMAIPPDGALRPVAAMATTLASRAANMYPAANYCPPLCTFNHRTEGKAEHIAAGLVLSVDLDRHPRTSLGTLKGLLGPPTVVVATGGEYIDPATGEAEPKLHAHWRLRTPTRTSETHAQLRYARELACRLVAGDATTVPINHPLRWPGSWHKKDPDNPRLARNAEINDTEIDLGDAVTVLEQAADYAGVDVRPAAAQSSAGHAEVTTAPSDQVSRWAATIPNYDVEFGDWKAQLLRIYGATGGSEEGRQIAHRWSAKSKLKYNSDNTNEEWNNIHRSPATRTGAKQLEHRAWDAIVERDDDPIWQEMYHEAIASYEQLTDEQRAQTRVATTDELWEMHGRQQAEYQRRRAMGNGAPAHAEATAPDADGAPADKPHDPVDAPPQPAPQPAPQAEAASQPRVEPQAKKPTDDPEGEVQLTPHGGLSPLIDILADEEVVPPFPTQVLPPPFRLWVEDVADRMQVPVDFVAIPLLVMAATMLGKDCKIQPKSHDDWTERPCLWGLIIGPTGVKKSPSMREALRTIRQIQRDLMEQYKREYAAWQARQQDKKKSEIDDPPLPERCLTNEATVEALATLMSAEHNANQRGILFYRDELSGWIESFNKYRGAKGDDIEFFLQCYSGGPFLVDRKGPSRSVYVPDTYLNIVGTTQPGVLDKILKDERIRGLAARFQLAVWPQLLPRIDMVDRRPNIEARQAVQDRLRDMRSIERIGEMRWSRAAYALYNKWWLKNANRSERAENSPFAGHLAKYEGTFPQLALVLHYMKHGRRSALKIAEDFETTGQSPYEIAEDTAEAVRQLIDGYLEPHARKIYGYLAAHPALPGAKRIAAWIREHRRTTVTVREVRRCGWREFARDQDDKAIMAALNLLDAYGWLRLRLKPPEETGGRPTLEGVVSPAAWAKRSQGE
jgi:hypothetical protein